MIHEPRYIIGAIFVGLGATLLIDLWALFLRRGFDIPSLNYCLLGRWILHLPGGTIVHRSIGAARPKPHECTIGWLAHYLIGTVFALMFVLIVSESWLERPTPFPAFGVRGCDHAGALPHHAAIVRARRCRFEDASSQPGEGEESDDPHGVRRRSLFLGSPRESDSSLSCVAPLPSVVFL